MATVAQETDPTVGRRLGWAGLAMLGVAVVGLVVRAVIVAGPLGVVDSDEAIGLLIAQRLSEGTDASVFLWANSHGGTLEAVVTAALFAVTGPSTVIGKVVPIAMYLGAAAVAAVLARRLADREAAAVAGLVAFTWAWLMPGWFVHLSTKYRLYYAASMLLAALAIWLVQRLDDRRTGRRTADRVADGRELLVLGLVVGLGLWTALFTFYAALPAGLWFAFRNRAGWRRWWRIVPGAVVGAAPWLLYNVRTGGKSLDNDFPVESTYFGRVEAFVTELLPRAVGLRAPGSGAWYGGTVGQIAFAVLVVGALVLLARRPRWSVLAAVLVGYPFVFAIPQASVYVVEPRYGIALVPALAAFVGLAVAEVVRRPMPALAVVAVLALVSIGGVRSLWTWAEARTGSWDLRSPALDEVIDHLEETGVTVAYADYWIAYRLTAETGEDVVASPVDFVRFEPYHLQVAEARGTTWIAHRNSVLDLQLAEAFPAAGLLARATTIGDFTVWTVDRHEPPDRFVPTRLLYAE